MCCRAVPWCRRFHPLSLLTFSRRENTSWGIAAHHGSRRLPHHVALGNASLRAPRRKHAPPPLRGKDCRVSFVGEAFRLPHPTFVSSHVLARREHFTSALRIFHSRRARISPANGGIFTHAVHTHGVDFTVKHGKPCFTQWHPPQVEQSWVQLEGISPVMAKVMVLLTAFISSLTASWASSSST